MHDVMPGTDEHLSEKMRVAYVGIDPTADSLHIGHLVSVMMLKHLQNCGHKPVVLLGGATGMIGDPSMKSNERNLLDEQTLRYYQDSINKQLSKYIDFTSSSPNAAKLVNNYDWMKEFTFLDFIRDVGKHISVNYMMAKDSVKKRLSGESSDGMSFTEFTYQLVQGYDFLHLYKAEECTLQMGGSDQWGNITTGTELIRRKEAGKAFALTWPLLTKADGSKFGKSESGNVWLDPEKTSPYKFYQFWLNVSDEDAEKNIRIFTFLEKEEIDALIEAHKQAPHLRQLQKKLAEEITTFVHSAEDTELAIKKSGFAFSNFDKAELESVGEEFFTDIFGEFIAAELPLASLQQGIDVVLALSDETKIFPSRGEARKAVIANAVSINKEKVAEGYVLSDKDIVLDKYILVQFGKKKYFVITVK